MKERFYHEACAEYLMRLNRYASSEIIEVQDEPAGKTLSEKERLIVLEREAERLKKHISGYTIALDIKGKKFSSTGFAGYISDKLNGSGDITFVIGGSIGLGQSILNAANERMSFSDMTFSHNLMRLILLEQLYRSFTIINNHPYHK